MGPNLIFIEHLILVMHAHTHISITQRGLSSSDREVQVKKFLQDGRLWVDSTIFQQAILVDSNLDNVLLFFLNRALKYVY